jgi:PKD repeat protein
VNFTDATQGHTATFSWDDGTANTAVTVPPGTSSASASHIFTATTAGVYGVNVTVTDDRGASATYLQYIVVYDPRAGFVTGGGGVNKFRIKIWDKATGTVVFDNILGGSDDIDTANPPAIGGGSIVVHK